MPVRSAAVKTPWRRVRAPALKIVRCRARSQASTTATLDLRGATGLSAPASRNLGRLSLGRLPLGEVADGSESVLAGLRAGLRGHDPQARPKRTPMRRTRPSRTVPSETEGGGSLAPARTIAWACSCPWKCAMASLVSRSASSLRVGNRSSLAAALVSASLAARFLFFFVGGSQVLDGVWVPSHRLVPSDNAETRLSPFEPPFDVLLRVPRGFRLVHA